MCNLREIFLFSTHIFIDLKWKLAADLHNWIIPNLRHISQGIVKQAAQTFPGLAANANWQLSIKVVSEQKRRGTGQTGGTCCNLLIGWQKCKRVWRSRGKRKKVCRRRVLKGVISLSAAGVALQSWLSARRANLSRRCQLDWSGEVSTLVNLSGSRLFKNYFIEQQTLYNCVYGSVCVCVCECASQTTWTHSAQKDVEQLLLLPSFPCSSHALDNFRSRVLVPHNLYSSLAVAIPLLLSLCWCVCCQLLSLRPQTCGPIKFILHFDWLCKLRRALGTPRPSAPLRINYFAWQLH